MIRILFSNNKYIPYLLSFAAIMLLFVFTRPGNLSESDDGLYYASLIRDSPYSKLFLPRHLFFLPLSKVLYQGFHMLFPGVNSYDTMVFQSMICAAGMVLLIFYMCRHVLRKDYRGSFLTSGMVLFSYGIWRYAMEAEIYLPVMFLLVLTLLMTFNLSGTTRDVWTGIIAALAVLIYQPALIPALVILAFAPGRTIRQALACGGIFGLLIFAGYLTGFLLSGPLEDSVVDYALSGARPMAGNPLAFLAIIPANVVSTYWMFEFHWFKELTQHLFMNKILAEEFYLIKQPLASEILSIGLTLLGGVLLSVLVFLFYKCRHFWKNLFRHRIYVVLLVWIALHALMLLMMDPSSLEPWLMINVPLILLLGAGLIPAQKDWGYPGLSLLFVLGFFLFNLFGGILLFRDQSYDLTRRRAEWLVTYATPQDVVIILGPITLQRYLSYFGTTQVINMELEFQQAARTMTKPDAIEGNIYLTGDVMDPFPAVLYRQKDMSARSINDLLKDKHLEAVTGKDIFTVYRLVKD